MEEERSSAGFGLERERSDASFGLEQERRGGGFEMEERSSAGFRLELVCQRSCILILLLCYCFGTTMIKQ